MTIHEVLHTIQQELKAPKDKYSTYGEYNYRSLEGIVEAVKPLLPEGVTLTFSDKLVEIASVVFVEGIGTLASAEGSISVSGFARHDRERKKMQSEQLTGSASSYARKYAANGLFAIDDTKDTDTDESHKERQAAETAMKKENAIRAGEIFDDHNNKLMGFESTEGDEFKEWWASKKDERQELHKLDTHKAVTLVANMKIKCKEFLEKAPCEVLIGGE